MSTDVVPVPAMTDAECVLIADAASKAGRYRLPRLTVTAADRQMFAVVGGGLGATGFFWLLSVDRVLWAALLLGAGLMVATALGVGALRRQAVADKQAVPTRRGWSSGELKLLNPPAVGFDGQIDVDLDAGTATVGPPAGAAETTMVLPSPVPRALPVEAQTRDAVAAGDVTPEITSAAAEFAARFDQLRADLAAAFNDADLAVQRRHKAAVDQLATIGGA